MSESNNNYLNDFLNETESENDLFSAIPFAPEETKAKADSSVYINLSDNEKKEEPPLAQKQAPLFAETLCNTPAVQTTQEESDPFAAALKKAQSQSEERLSESFAEKEAIFTYGKAKDPISEHDCTFEELRQKYETDFPELSETKKVSWTINYGKVTKSIVNPGSDKVYDIKTEIEKSKSFLDSIKKAKTDAEKHPECLVKPRVTAQSKGEALRLPSYKEICFSNEEAQTSAKPIVILRGVVNTNTLRSNKEQHSRVRECCLFIFLQSGGCLLHHTIEGVFSQSVS